MAKGKGKGKAKGGKGGKGAKGGAKSGPGLTMAVGSLMQPPTSLAFWTEAPPVHRPAPRPFHRPPPPKPVALYTLPVAIVRAALAAQRESVMFWAMGAGQGMINSTWDPPDGSV